MRRFYLLMCFLLLMGVRSMSASDFNAIQVYLAEDQTAVFLFDDTPVVTFDSIDVEITTAKEKVVYEAKDFVKYVFFKVEDTGVKDVKGGLVVKFSQDAVEVSGAAPQTLVYLYGVDGQQVASAKTDALGAASLATSSLAPGAYIVKTQSQTFKFMKR